MLTFTILVSYISETQNISYKEASEKADALCQNLYWTPYNTNEHIVNACSDVWSETYNYKK